MVRPKSLVPKGQLKILDKLKIIKLHAEEPKIVIAVIAVHKCHFSISLS